MGTGYSGEGLITFHPSIGVQRVSKPNWEALSQEDTAELHHGSCVAQRTSHLQQASRRRSRQKRSRAKALKARVGIEEIAGEGPRSASCC